MYVASAKRKENIAEYLLYMWQIEDIIRANSFDIELIKRNVIDKIPELEDKGKQELTEWYDSLIDMMRREDVMGQGHLQMNKNVLGSLAELHNRILEDKNPKFDGYRTEFYRTLPFIVELRARSGENKPGEIETCFNALYGMLMLRLSGREISSRTKEAISQISRFVALLAKDFHLDEDDRLFDNKIDEKI